MTQFNNITYNADSQTLEVGGGHTWPDIYQFLEPLNINIVGGQIEGVGVEVVLPNGTFATASATVNKDLYFGLRVSLFNFRPWSQINDVNV